MPSIKQEWISLAEDWIRPKRRMPYTPSVQATEVEARAMSRAIGSRQTRKARANEASDRAARAKPFLS